MENLAKIIKVVSELDVGPCHKKNKQNVETYIFKNQNIFGRGKNAKI